MAKILTTAIVADIRNKLNGSVFSKNRYGSYVRTKVTPVNPQSNSQQNVRNILSTQSQAWRGLTEDQRQSWIDAAINFPFTDIFGNSKILSGSTLFVKLNSNLVNAGVAPLTDAPSPAAIPQLTLGALTATAGTQALSQVFAATPVPADFKICVQATGNIGPGKNFVKNQFRTISYLAAAATSPANLLAAFTAVHGALVEGQKVFIRAFYVSTITGQAGIPVQTSTIVGA